MWVNGWRLVVFGARSLLQTSFVMRHDHRQRYTIEVHDQPVARIGSIEGLEAALAKQVATVSLADPQDTAWLGGWTASPTRRQLLVRDRVRHRSISLDALAIRDATGDGMVYELSVIDAKIVGHDWR